MDRENFDAIIARYLEKFALTNAKPHEEYFKWQAIDCFQTNWNIDAEDLYDSFTRAVAKTDVLLDGGHSAPSSGIKSLLKLPEEVETVREAFRKLLYTECDEKARDLLVEEFIQTVNARIKAHWPNDSYRPQTTRSALCYLALARPDRDFFYMFTKAENWAYFTEFGFDIGSGSNFSLPIYYRMCNELVDAIRESDALRRCNEERMQAAGVSLSDDFHTLAYDIMYCATTYGLYVDLPTYEAKGVKYRIQRAAERQVLAELQAAASSAKKALDAFLAGIVPPPALTGQAVRHSSFGAGTILDQTGDHLTVRFGDTVKTLLSSTAFGKNFLTLEDPELFARFLAAEEAAKQKAALEKAAAAAQQEFEKKRSDFQKKWKKAVHNEEILPDEEP